MGFDLKNIQDSKKPSGFDIDKLLKTEIHLFANHGFSNKKKEAFYTELNVLLKSGLTLKDALTISIEEQKKKKDKERLQFILNSLIEGRSLFESMKLKKDFSPYEYYSIQIGEKTGSLQKVIEQLADFYKRKNAQRRMISSALSYPIIVLITAFLAITFMLKFVVPMFEGIFQQNNKELPSITKFIISLSNYFSSYFYHGLVVILILVLAGLISKNKNWYRGLRTGILIKIPFVGEFQRKIKLAQFTQSMYLLTSSKVAILEALELTKKMINYLPVEKALDKVAKQLLTGKSLYESFKNQKIFDSRMSSLIKVAEETNQNEVIFKRLADQYNEEVDYRAKLISSTIEPIIILVLGSIVAIILIAMYLPMFTMSNLM